MFFIPQNQSNQIKPNGSEIPPSNQPNDMDGAAATAGGGGGGPAPFLLKTYDMVEDRSTDEIVSWSSTRNSFVVWNPPEFARLLLPTYFKHNNFSSFIRQLNTYGFRKIDPERWEFANEDFVQDQKHLLKNIHRRKPIHSHSNPQGSAVDPERAAFEEEIDKISREKTALEANLLRFKQQQPAAKLRLEELTQRISGMEQRQENLLAFLEKVVQNSDFVEHLGRKLESIDLSAYNKKRRLPQAEDSQTAPEDSFIDNQSFSRAEFGNIFHQDFSNKLRLELSPAVSDINLASHSTQSSNEDGGSPQKMASEGCTKDVHSRSTGPVYTPETLDLSDTGTSFTFNMDSSLSRKARSCDSPRLHSLQQRLTSSEEGEGHISCQLNLTLASSPLQANKSQYSARISQEIGKSSDGSEIDFGVPQKNRNHSNDNKTLSSLHDTPTNNPGPAAAPARVNDVFWEQFLTERPGASDSEEASSTFRANPNEISRNTSNVEHLTL